jgi:hypothetical protein
LENWLLSDLLLTDLRLFSDLRLLEASGYLGLLPNLRLLETSGYLGLLSDLGLLETSGGYLWLLLLAACFYDVWDVDVLGLRAGIVGLPLLNLWALLLLLLLGLRDVKRAIVSSVTAGSGYFNGEWIVN